jgi:hypothetical protein
MPTDVIQMFVNHSWRFIDVYRRGWKDDAAVWDVKSQKGHRFVSEKAMSSLEALSEQ